MSIVALKRKTNATKNQSTGQDGFSINGTTRNQGYIGQSLQSRTLIHTPFKGSEPKGHGGCCGAYSDDNIIEPSEICCLEDSKVVKPSVLSTRGMLAKKYRWINRPAPYGVVKPSATTVLNSQAIYLDRLKRRTLRDVCPEPIITPVKKEVCKLLRNEVGAPLFSRHVTKCRDAPITKDIAVKAQSERLDIISEECSRNDPTNIVYTKVLRVPLIGS